MLCFNCFVFRDVAVCEVLLPIIFVQSVFFYTQLVFADGKLVVWIPGIPENERDWQPWMYPDSNPKPPGPKPPIYHQLNLCRIFCC